MGFLSSLLSSICPV